MNRKDAEFVYNFAAHVAELSRSTTSLWAERDAKIVKRIAYCALSEACAKEREERYRHSFVEQYPHQLSNEE